MRLLVYADLQATDGSELCHTQPGVTLQHFRIRKFFADIVNIYKEHKCSGFVDLGDTTDDRSSIPVTTLDVLCEGLESLPDKEGYRLKLTGNHEQFLRDTTVSNWRLFQPYFDVVQDRSVTRIGETLVFCASYPKDHEELAKWLVAESAKHRTAKKVLFGHFQVKGAFLNSGQSKTGIPAEALAAFDQVLLGHIHGPQSISKRIHYVGSPFQQDWGEAGQKKRVGVLDLQTMAVTWVTLTGYPEYREVGLADFQKAAHTEDEHRYRVALSSHAEAEQFYAHPAFNRAVGVYNYDTAEASKTEEQPRDWSFEGTLRRYIQKVPYAHLKVNEEEMLEFGRVISAPDHS